MNFGKSQYITAGEAHTLSSRKNNVFRAFFTTMIASLVLLATVLAIFGGTIVAYADSEEDAKKEISKLADDYIVKNSEGEMDLGATLDIARKDTDPNTFGYILTRLFSTDYINKAPDASKNKQPNNGTNCRVSDPHAGTPLYHNCDVPNMLTEFTQDFLAVIMQNGPIGAEASSSKAGLLNLGLPDNIPGNGAPINPNDRNVKYTGLELFGYNFNYTSYAGEWDHIKVMTAARSMSNFGFIDGMKLGASAVFNGIASGVGTGVTNFVSSLTSGDIFGAIGGFWGGLFESGSSRIVNTVLDTSDQNVFSTHSWYRIGYGSTLYNARELTSDEVAAKAKSELFKMIQGTKPAEAQTPADLESIKGGLPEPKEAISKCLYKNASGVMKEYGATDVPPGATEASCIEQAKKSADAANAARDAANENNSNIPGSIDGGFPVPDVEPKHEWSIDGTQKLETIAMWISNNSATLAIAEKYNMGVTINTDESKRNATVASVRSEWAGKYNDAELEYLKAEQEIIGSDWMNEQLSPGAFEAYVTEDKSRNYNAPWNRFVCTDANGDDIKTASGDRVFLYDYNGNLNSSCKEVRAPIQNGFFGNGSDSAIPNDTRYDMVDTSIFGSIFKVTNIYNVIGNFGLWLSTAATRLSGAIMGLAFSPLLSTFGIDTLVVTGIAALRDSLFFGLMTLLIGVAGIMSLWSAGKNRDYGRQAVSLLIMALTIFTGALLMFMPAKVIQLVDEVPAAIERSIVGNIFSVGNTTTDQLCTASGTPTEVKDTDLEGKVLPYNASEGTRSLLCENWRAFAFNPWVYGQWGTNAANLYASGTNNDNTMQNTNGSLVGNASVKMGGGIDMKNWATYQLDTVTTGTASFDDPKAKNGKVNRNFYKIIDMQAGPNNGAGTDGRYFDTWSGNGIVRPVVGLLGAGVALLGAFTVIVYSFAKIQIAFVITLMLIIMPIMFLMGIHPTAGRMKLKGYFGSIIGLILQRIVLVLLLAVMFRILSEVGTISTDYFMTALFTVIICIAFLKLRKPVLDMVFTGVSNTMGQPIGKQFIDKPKSFVGNQIGGGSLVRNKIQEARSIGGSVATGAIAGIVTGKGVRNSVSQTAKSEISLLKNRQRRAGYGVLQTAAQGVKAGKEAAVEKMDDNVYVSKVKDDVHKNTKQYAQYEEALKTWNTWEKDAIGTEEYAIDPTTQERVAKPQPPGDYRVKDRSIRELRSLSKLAKLQQKTEGKEVGREQAKIESAAAKEIKGNIAKKGDFDEYMSDAERYSRDSDSRIDTSESKRKEAKLASINKKLDKGKTKVAKKDSRQYNRSLLASNEKMKQTLEDIQQRARNYELFLDSQHKTRAAQEQAEYDRKAEEQLEPEGPDVEQEDVDYTDPNQHNYHNPIDDDEIPLPEEPEEPEDYDDRGY